ncbi:MAG: hypothetical protein ACLUOF_04820 [Ruminococcus sp.]
MLLDHYSAGYSVLLLRWRQRLWLRWWLQQWLRRMRMLRRSADN